MEEQEPLEEVVEPDNDLKNILIEYVGDKLELDPGADFVTLEMIVDAMAEEFPDVVLAIAEENWVRGYHQALQDVETGEKLYQEEIESST